MQSLKNGAGAIIAYQLQPQDSKSAVFWRKSVL